MDRFINHTGGEKKGERARRRKQIVHRKSAVMVYKSVKA